MDDWFKDWFSSDEYLNVYRHRDSHDANKSLDLILRNITLNNNAEVLDAACGAGRHSILLSQMGFKVFAFDLSKNLLNIAKNDSAKNNIKLKLFCSDLRNLALNSSFDLVLNMFTSFGYFNTDEENYSFFKTTESILKNNGYLVLDYLNKYHVESTLVKYSEKNIDGKIINEHRYIKDNRVHKDIIISHVDKQYSFYESVRLYSKSEIVNKLNSFGLTEYKTFGNYSGDPFNEKTSERLIIIFKK